MPETEIDSMTLYNVFGFLKERGMAEMTNNYIEKYQDRKIMIKEDWEKKWKNVPERGFVCRLCTKSHNSMIDFWHHFRKRHTNEAAFAILASSKSKGYNFQ